MRAGRIYYQPDKRFPQPDPADIFRISPCVDIIISPCTKARNLHFRSQEKKHDSITLLRLEFPRFQRPSHPIHMKGGAARTANEAPFELAFARCPSPCIRRECKPAGHHFKYSVGQMSFNITQRLSGKMRRFAPRPNYNVSAIVASREIKRYNAPPITGRYGRRRVGPPHLLNRLRRLTSRLTPEAGALSARTGNAGR